MMGISILLSLGTIFLTIYQYPNLTGIEHIFQHGIDRISGSIGFKIDFIEYIFVIIPHKLLMNSNYLVLLTLLVIVPWLVFSRSIDSKIKATFGFFALFGIAPALLFIEGTIKHDYLITDISIFLIFLSLYGIASLVKMLNFKRNKLVGKVALILFVSFNLLNSYVILKEEYENRSESPLEYPLALAIKENTRFGEEVLTDLNVRYWTMPFFSDSYLIKNVTTVENFISVLDENKEWNFAYFVTTDLEKLKGNDYFYDHGGTDDNYYRFKEPDDELIVYLYNNFEYSEDNGFTFFKLQNKISD